MAEREVEREAVEVALAGSRRGQGRFVVLYGQAGIGRSSLLRASTLSAEASGHVVLDACGSDLERGYGFGLVRQLLEARVAGLTAKRQQSLLSHAGVGAASALGMSSSDPRVSSAGFEQIEGVYRLLVGLATEAPVLLAIDDLQWSDRPSLDLVCFLGHRVSQLPITVIAAWRRGEPGVKAGRLQALAGMPQTFFLAPAPLSAAGVRTVISREIGASPSDEAVATVHRQTGGQPFLVAELVARLRLSHLPVRAGSRDAIESVTPESVRRNVVARLGRHPEPVQRFARAVAVLAEASLMDAAALAGVERDRACAACAALVRAGIFRDDSTIAYAHPIVRRALYETLSFLERSELHMQAAAVLCDAAAGHDSAAVVRAARHLLECEPAGNPRFATVLREAAVEAAGDGAVDCARRFYERALGEIEEVAAHAEVLVSLAELELQAGDLESSDAHASAALAVASAPSQRTAASVVWAQAVAGRDDWRAAAALLDNEALTRRTSDPELELGLRATAAVLRASAREPSARSDAVAGFADLPGATIAERAMLAACASELTLTGAGTAERVADISRRALSGEATHASYLAGHAAVLADSGKLVEGELARRDSQESRTAPRAESVVADLALRCQLALWRGELAAAYAVAADGLSLLEGMRPSPVRRRLRADLLAARVLVALARGDDEEAGRALAQLDDAADDRDPIVTGLRIAVALSRSEPAVELAGQAEPQPVGVIAPASSLRSWAALAHHAAGDQVRALARATDHLELARAWGGPSVLGRALVVRGLVGSHAERLGFLQEAVVVLEDSPARLELAHATVELGSALRRARRPRDARAHLTAGGDLAHQCGAGALVARVRAELVAAGARPRRAAFSGVSSLTHAERRVAMLAASGMTTRAIAQELIVSPKTVSGQLGAVYLKLDVHDRAALAAVMQSADGTSAERERVH